MNIEATRMRICRVCGEDAKYHVEYCARDTLQMKSAYLCAEHSQKMWRDGIPQKSRFWSQEVCDRAMASGSA